MQSGRPQRSKSLICDCAFRFGVLDSFLMSVFTQGICLAQLRSSAFSVHPAHHTKCTKTRRKHEKEKDERASMHIVPSPVPQHQMALTRKPSVCLAEVVRFQRPTRQRNSRKGGQGRKEVDEWRHMRKDQDFALRAYDLSVQKSISFHSQIGISIPYWVFGDRF